jgi:C4-dicarboxylate-specific signal transduction histidine kinase
MPFSKLENSAELNPNGVGLGLCICENILKELGGFIRVSSTTEA